MEFIRTEPLHIKIPVSLAERIDFVSVCTGMNKAAVVVVALEQYLKSEKIES